MVSKEKYIVAVHLRQGVGTFSWFPAIGVIVAFVIVLYVFSTVNSCFQKSCKTQSREFISDLREVR